MRLFFKQQRINELPVAILSALGGENYFKDLDACITRLRVQVKDIKGVDKKRLKELRPRSSRSGGKCPSYLWS